MMRRLGMRHIALPAARHPAPGATSTSRIRQALLPLLADPGLGEVAPCTVLVTGDRQLSIRHSSQRRANSLRAFVPTSPQRQELCCTYADLEQLRALGRPRFSRLRTLYKVAQAAGGIVYRLPVKITKGAL